MGGRPGDKWAVVAGCKGRLEVKLAFGLGRRESSPYRGLESVAAFVFILSTAETFRSGLEMVS